MSRTLPRRDFLAGAAAAMLAAATACSIRGKRTKGGDGPASLRPLPSKSGRLVMANWPLYIDVDEDTGRRPTLEQFQKETGIVVEYKEAIDDNDPFFGTIREPLSRGRSTGWDLIVVTDWLVARMASLGYLEPMHMDRLANVRANLARPFRLPETGGLQYGVPWQAGVTGIGYNPKLTGREIESLDDLFDAKFKGKVGMLSDMRDMVHLSLLREGVEPAKATTADVRRSVDALKKQRDDGIVRDYYENDYTDALAKGDLALCLAYSGDVFQLQKSNPDLRFVVPREGGILFVDALAIPKGAEHPADAHELIDFVYRPAIAAQIAEYVQFMTPVPSAKPIIEQHAADAVGDDKTELEALIDSPLIFPTPEILSRLRRYRALSEDEEREWNGLFSEVVQA